MKTSLEQALRDRVNGEVRFDPVARRIYSVDASIFEVVPTAVVVPKDLISLINAVRIAGEHQIPCIARGAGTGIAGGAVGEGLIIDTSKYLKRILEINTEENYVLCEPGVVQNQLNDALAPLGYRLGPDTSTGDRATVGGMLGTNAAGAHALRFGTMADHVLAVDLILSEGESVPITALNDSEIEKLLAKDSRLSRIVKDLLRIRDSYRQEIEERFPCTPRRVSGYNIDRLIAPGPLNLPALLCGAEGSLGIVAHLKLRIVRKPSHTGLCILHFDDVMKAMEPVPDLLPFDPYALELIDDKIITAGRQSLSLRNRLSWLKGSPKALVIAEFDGDSEQELSHKLRAFHDFASSQTSSYDQSFITDEATMASVWELRKAGLGLLLSKRSYSRAIGFLEDVAVAPEKLAEFMKAFNEILLSKGKDASFYGHLGDGVVHVRPYIDLSSQSEHELMLSLMEKVTDLLVKNRGSLSGEHGDGFIRSWLNERLFGSKIYQAFREIKTAFDPHGLMNPGKIVHVPGPWPSQRLDPNVQQAKIDTFLNFAPEGGFNLAVDMCNGNAKCRSKTGLMCPSFQASDDEYHSTRARAQILRSIINGKVSPEELSGQGLYDVLDLCLQCKGCKKECPSQVDMAKMKSEFLYHYNKKHGIPLRSYVFGYVDKLNRWMQPLAPLFNRMMGMGFSKQLLSWIGITPERSLPLLARKPLSRLWKHHTAKESDLILFNDCFTEHHQPEIGLAAQKLFTALGHHPSLCSRTCCGRPLISKGLLPQARAYAKRLLDRLYPFVEKGLPIIGLEPSCILTIKDDYASLIDDDRTAAVADACMSSETFLQQEGAALKKLSKQDPFQVACHSHCHQKALEGTEACLEVLQQVPGIQVTPLNSGCCGMAGSFGYEKEHYEFSMRVGETRLFPAIRSCPEETLIIASGFSCRHQIAEGTGRQAQHLVQLLAKRL